jgi:ABC transporter substrate binding protein
VDQYRHSAGLVDKILRGTKPGDIPVEQPTKFDLIINRTTAKVLGLTIPETLLATADQVIAPAAFRKGLSETGFVLIWFLWNFAPGSGTPLQYYLQDTLHAKDAQ